MNSNRQHLQECQPTRSSDNSKSRASVGTSPPKPNPASWDAKGAQQAAAGRDGERGKTDRSIKANVCTKLATQARAGRRLERLSLGPRCTAPGS
eukprot:8145421-Pyramimonas_sp.AAC.1